MFMAASATMLVSCGGNQNKQEDPKDVATEQNDAKFDDSDTEKDTDFAVKAADGGLFEVEAGKLAQQKATSPQVKEFAKLMVDDHTKASAELKALAATKNISLPAALSDAKQKDLQNLQEKSGADFDNDYMDAMVKAHEEDVDAFEKEAEDGVDADVKSWAAGKVTTLRHHLDMAKTTRDAVKNAKK